MYTSCLYYHILGFRSHSTLREAGQHGLLSRQALATNPNDELKMPRIKNDLIKHASGASLLGAPKDLKVRILHAGSKAQDRWDSRCW